jgi:hypothetical protein
MADTLQDQPEPTPEPRVTGVWMVIEITQSTVALDHLGGIKLDGKGRMVKIPDEGIWKPLLPEEVPEWLKSEDAIRDMVAGQRLCLDPEAGGHWYRGITCYPNATNTVN